MTTNSTNYSSSISSDFDADHDDLKQEDQHDVVIVVDDVDTVHRLACNIAMQLRSAVARGAISIAALYQQSPPLAAINQLLKRLVRLDRLNIEHRELLAKCQQSNERLIEIDYLQMQLDALHFEIDCLQYKINFGVDES